MSEQPLVSVRTITYNHEKYITQCLESILMQRTNFPFEIVIGEDCSTDRTRGIVMEYEKKYPDKIRVITSEQNVGPARNTRRVQQACRGKYHAFCEGDDYWIDPLKLQKQVDLMEAHPDITLCFHNALIVNQDCFGARFFFTSTMKETLTFAEACHTGMPMPSVLARSEILATLPAWRSKVWCPDVVLRLWCAHHGNLGYLNQVISVYRRHPGGMNASMRPFREKRFAEEMYLYREFDKETHYQHTDLIQKMIEQTNERFHRERVGWFLYYLLRPHKTIAKIKEYYDMIDRQRRT